MDRRRAVSAVCAVVGVVVAGAAPLRGEGPRARVAKAAYGKTPAGEAVELYTLTNARGAEATIASYGGTVVSLMVPDRAGNKADVVLGFGDLDGYVTGKSYFGALIGRYGNRIGKARFSLKGAEYPLARNNGENHLHGGLKGFDKVVWRVREVPAKDGAAVELRYSSKDGEEGYPGNLSATVVYTWTDADELRIDYEATTDKATVVNLTNHSYFNLAAAGDQDVLGHELMIDADRFTPVDAGLIPTGELRSVEGTPFDFRKPTAIGARIGAADEQIAFGKGYDHNYVLNGKAGELRLVARAREPKSGRVMELLTTEPGVQFYSGNFLDGVTGKGGRVYRQRYGFCLETQHFPDSPNKPAFPSTVLDPGGRYRTTTVYRFTTDKR